MVSTWVAGQIQTSPQTSPLGVWCGVDHTAHAGLDESSGTHGARFKRDDQGAVVESPVALDPSGLPQRNEFSVTKRIPRRFTSVASVANAATFGIQHHRCHRHFSSLTDPLSTLKQDGHPALHGGLPHQRTSSDL